jgi:hypothetical protein
MGIGLPQMLLEMVNKAERGGRGSRPNPTAVADQVPPVRAESIFPSLRIGKEGDGMHGKMRSAAADKPIVP